MHTQIALWPRFLNFLKRFGARSDSSIPAATTIFVCVKTRQDGRPCCGSQGAGAVLAALGAEIDARSSSLDELSVRPCGCLDRCDRGVVAIAYCGAAACRSKPPKKKLDKLLHPRLARFEQVEPRDVATVLNSVQSLAGPRGHQ